MIYDYKIDIYVICTYFSKEIVQQLATISTYKSKFINARKTFNGSGFISKSILAVPPKSKLEYYSHISNKKPV